MKDKDFADLPVSPEAEHSAKAGAKALKQHWNDELNKRRCELIDKQFDSLLTTDEEQELGQLQIDMLAHRRKVAPLPLKDLRKLASHLLLAHSQPVIDDVCERVEKIITLLRDNNNFSEDEAISFLIHLIKERTKLKGC